MEDVSKIARADSTIPDDANSFEDDPIWEVDVRYGRLKLLPKRVRAASRRVAEFIVISSLGDTASVVGAKRTGE